MADSILGDISGSVSDLFAGFGATAQANLKAQGLNLQAQGQRINAQGDIIKAEGDTAEAGNYDLASSLAAANEKYTETSTAIKQAQNDRQITQTIGGQQADVAGAGFASSGSSLDILRDSAAQGALTKAVAGQQGLITEAGYTEQAQSYTTLAASARTAAAGENAIAGETDTIADQTDQLATATQAAGKTAATGDFISSAIKGIAGVAAIGALLL